MSSEASRVSSSERLQSLDALRGFDMLWIIGGGALVASLASATGWGWLHQVGLQVYTHVEWEGFRFIDNIFMLFMFLSGAAIPYALGSRMDKGVSRGALLAKVTRRMVLLVLLGIVYNGALKNGFENMRVASVLAQIGIAYFFAAVIYMNTRSVGARVGWVVGILACVTVWHLLIPVPGFGSGILTAEGSVNAWVDQHFLPGRRYGVTYDPEGPLCILAATSITLMGTLAGSLLRSGTQSPGKKTLILAVAGAALVAAAVVIHPFYPVIKKISTAPFNMLTTGVSALLLALFYYVIDVKGWRQWAFPFRVIGMNSITIYMACAAIDFGYTSRFLLGWLEAPAGDYGKAIIVAGALAIKWLMLYVLYKNRVFLRV